MNKKLICFVLSLILVCTGTMAFAASSKTTSDLTSAVLGQTTGVVVEPIVQSADAVAVLNDITAFVANNNGPVVDFFGDTVKAGVAALLPAGFDVSTLVMNELISANVSGYVAGTDTLAVTFNFATAYADGTPIVVLVGIKNGDSVTWMPVKAEAVNGAVKVTFTPEVLAMINGREVMLAVLSEGAGAK